MEKDEQTGTLTFKAPDKRRRMRRKVREIEAESQLRSIRFPQDQIYEREERYQAGAQTSEVTGGPKTDAERLTNLASIIRSHYGPSFASGCFYDSECVKNISTSARNGGDQGNGLGDLNSRSWRYQKCSEVAYLQSAPLDGRRLRSKRLTIEALTAQCDHVFGDGTSARLRVRSCRRCSSSPS